HGHVRVRELRCVLRAEDPALLAEVLATRALAHLGLSLLAPTVLGSAEPVDATLAALRAAGYAPVAEDATGAAVLQRAPRRRAGTAAGRASGKPAGKPAKVPPPRTPADLDPRELAKTLLAGAVTDPPAWMSEDLRRVPKDRLTSMDLVAGYADNLPGDQKALLADAVDHDYPVRIRYTSGGGARTERTIEALRLDDDVLIAHCHLRNAERHFVLERITEVSPV
ncbi:MAG TPA: WYL domain-containing protein, partial [Rugosimonospora sp.]|nr:WYL domain-containing protein [Rugosimonospora sp.]